MPFEETKKITGQVEIAKDVSEKIEKEVKNIPDLRAYIENFLQKNTTELLGVILAGAVSLGSSDIHLEPEEDQAKIRIRMDGVLQDVLILPKKTHAALASRVKLLSGLKLNVSDRPQDGRFSILFNDKEIEIRASSLPAEYGETMVFRILDPKNLIEIKDLGLRDDQSEIFNKEISKPNGMIVVTGPTGSGKTTTLYAVLKKLNNPEIKIITIEDPIEYHLAGISQTQVDPAKGYDFASGLRSLMRQDPDVILVGEIRDLETANIALQAALTGHLVLSTLHTNDAAGTIARLQALGEKPMNIAPAINMVIAQRLIRKVCKKCAGLRKPTEQELKNIKKAIELLPKKNNLNLKITKDTKIPSAKAGGCEFCNNTGYKGRIGIYEFFLVDDEIENFILKSPSISDLRDLAVKKGMIPMAEDGYIKVLQGLTTMEEVNSAAG